MMAKTKKSIPDIFDENLKWFRTTGSEFPGNILKPHGRNHTAMLFWKFSDDAHHRDETKSYFGELARSRKITSASEQAVQSVDHKAKRTQTLFMGFYLTEPGLQYFGWPMNEEGFEGLTFNKNFPGGSFIEDRYKEKIDGVLYLAHGTKELLESEIRYYRSYIEKNLRAELVQIENGRKLKNKHGQYIEPFGYPDGISQAVFLDGNDSAIRPIEHILVTEPMDGETGAKSYGSYLTFLKLEQDIRTFKKLERQIEEKLSANGANLNNSIGEMVVGRTLDGAPLAGPAIRGNDNFDYSKDKEGLKCPFHAHIRKMNPRDSKNPVPLIVRRGVPFGINSDNYTGNREDISRLNGLVGLLFLSFQKNMDAFLHFWNQAKQTTGGSDEATITGADPIIGYADELIPAERKNGIFQHSYQIKDGSKTTAMEVPGFGGAVKLRGALQLYAPSLTFFKKNITSIRGVNSTLNLDKMPTTILKPFLLFGDPREAFIQTLIQYHAKKSSNDSEILAYTYNNETHGPGQPPPDKRGYIEDYTKELGPNDELAFEFYFPVRKGDMVSLKAEMVDWEKENQVAVHYNDLEQSDNPRSGNWVNFKAEFTPGDPLDEPKVVQVLFDDPNTNHGYCRMLLAGHDGTPLQEILKKDMENTEIKRYILRVKSKITPYEPRGVFYLREDTVLLVILKKN